MSEPIHIISLGAGVQSSTMALMAAAGEIKPMPTAAIFADTQAEPKSVYTWLEWLEKQLPFPVYRVSRGSLVRESLTIRVRKDGSGKWAKNLIPAFILNADGSEGIMGRQCTSRYKLDMLEKKSRELGGIARGQKTVGVINWIGISTDEIWRAKPARVPWAENRWPMVEKRMARRDCVDWMLSRGFPKPPRSACKFCPYHNDAEWRRLRDEEPQEFAESVQYEKDLQEVKRQTDNLRGVPFLHASRKPLGEIDFSTEEERGQLNMFNNECEGMCGV
jgi:hypothetical protein